MKKNIKSIINDITGLREKIKTFIEGLPEACSDVKLLSNKPRCGVVKFSAIQKNQGILCPSYYLNSTAKEQLLKMLETTAIERLETVITQIIETGRLTYGSPPHIKLNPEFIEALRKIWEEE